MTHLDLIIVFAYVLLLFCVGVCVGIRETSEDFLILSRKANVFLVAFSIISSWVGVGVVAGTAAAAYDSGISFALTSAVGAVVAVVAAGLFAPRIKAFGDRHGAHTIGDFFGIRYSRGARLVVSGLVVCVYSLFTAVQFNGLARMLNVWTALDFRFAIGFAAVAVIVYTAFAGIKSDFYTDAVHFVVMILVLLFVLVPVMASVTNGFRTLGTLPASFFRPFSFGGPGYFFGGIVFGIGVVFVSMELWQRIYASTTQKRARGALVAAAFGVIPFYVVAALAGLVLRSSGAVIPNRDLALFVMMKQFLPAGVLGLGVAAFVACFISAANSMIMVVSATLTKDFVETLRRSPLGEKTRLRVARALTLIAGLLGAILSLLVRDIVSLSILALFLLLVMLPAVLGGFFWRRATASAAIWSVLAGLLATLASISRLGPNAFLPGVLVSTMAFVGLSLVTRHGSSEIPKEQLC